VKEGGRHGGGEPGGAEKLSQVHWQLTDREGIKELGFNHLMGKKDGDVCTHRRNLRDSSLNSATVFSLFSHLPRFSFFHREKSLHNNYFHNFDNNFFNKLKNK
jgi:hypothetical protein